MIIDASCSFCKKPLKLEMDDDYARIFGDPFKLVEKASCDRCSTLRTRQRRIEEAMEKLAGNLRCNPAPEERQMIHEALCRTTKAYLKIACSWLHAEGVAWEEEIVNQIMRRPDKLDLVTKQIWAMARSGSQRQLV